MGKNSGGFGFRLAVFIIIILLFAVFLFQNTQSVSITYIAWSFSLPKGLLMFGSLLVGIIAGLMLGWLAYGRKKKEKIHL
ncbi:MAG: lipopolysaccharide assembly protein LapA domain-containing protein [Nitrospiraceae bacterium]|nr:lipopolysaccharide assembly protein LapA domain-containing protein [Nitrospiraceae bacterium]